MSLFDIYEFVGLFAIYISSLLKVSCDEIFFFTLFFLDAFVFPQRLADWQAPVSFADLFCRSLLQISILGLFCVSGLMNTGLF